MRAIDDRLGSGKFFRNHFNKIFPDHWSFMLGEIALYCFGADRATRPTRGRLVGSQGRSRQRHRRRPRTRRASSPS
jgi:hypothetical protein